MAYTKLSLLIQLATDLQASSIGLTYEDIITKFNLRGYKFSQKTIKRMLDGLLEIGLETEKIILDTDHHLTKRFKMRNIPTYFLRLDKNEKASLERHLQTLSEGPEARAISKILADNEPLGIRLTNSVSELIERTAHTGNIQPKVKYNEKQLAILESAIEGFTEVSFKYRGQNKNRLTLRCVKPYGLLFGRFAYLIASERNKPPVSYRLDLLENVVDTKKMFVPKNDWNFKNWVIESFGVFHGDKMLDIKIRFAKEVAKRAEKIIFHPSQKFSYGKNNSLLLEIRCQGHKELIHELLHPDWMGFIKIEKPYELKKEFLEYIDICKKIAK